MGFETVSPLNERALAEPDIAAQDLNPQTPLDLPTTRIPDIKNLPHIPNFEKIARNDPWIGPIPCSEHMFFAPTSLPMLSPRISGPRQTEPIKSTNTQWIKDQPTYLYKSERGVTLKLVKPVVEYYDLNGQRYRDVQNDMFSRRPLERLRETEARSSSDIQEEIEKTGNGKAVTLADISSPSSLSYRISGLRDRYKLDVKNTVLTSSFLITLPRWTNYDQASERDQRKWDDLLCNAAHHELGHLRIRLDMLAETLDGYADLPPAGSFKEMEEIVIAYRKDINARVEARQDAYHIYNGGGTRRGMTELPYADLPFPWLENPEIKTAEQLPAQQ